MVVVIAYQGTLTCIADSTLSSPNGVLFTRGKRSAPWPRHGTTHGAVLFIAAHAIPNSVQIEAQRSGMRIQIHIIAVLFCLLMWGGSYHVAKASYHVGQCVGVVPNLHIKHHVRQVLNRID